MDDLSDLLLPRPQELEATGERLRLEARPRIDAPPEAPAVALERIRKAVPEGVGESVRIRLRLDPEGRHGPEGYRLEVASSGIELVAETPAGLFYAAATLVQWIELHCEDGAPWPLPGVVVRDRPDFARRAVMLDVSRDKVPRLETLLDLVDLLAGLKVNQLQLYMEHTFAYRDHETVWRDASPLTAEDVRRLDDYCAERFVELVPNQNSFGHLHRWLRHEPYRRLAECPEGIDHPFSTVREPFGLCATDERSVAFLAGLYDELLPNFRSLLLNVGLDETLDLGLGRSRAACEERGKARVYLEFLCEVHALAAARGRRILLWGDIILNHPELIPELPEDIVVLEWGYEADHPFAEDTRRFAAAGRELWVCPGTSSWSSFAGRSTNALANLASAARNGHENGAAGYVVTDWGDHGHLQPLAVSYLGLTAGAGFAWNVATAKEPQELPIAEILDRHVFRDRAGVLGQAARELGDTYLLPGPPPKNGSALFFLTVFALMKRERERVEGVSVEGLTKALEHVEAVASRLGGARPELGELASSELEWAAGVLCFAARLGSERWRGGDLASFEGVAAPRRRELAGELRGLLETYRELFLARNRPGGLEDSVGRLGRVAELLDV